jgi:hypothetical protein
VLENMLTENASRPDLRGYWWASEPPLVRAELADQALRTPIANAHSCRNEGTADPYAYALACIFPSDYGDRQIQLRSS